MSELALRLIEKEKIERTGRLDLSDKNLTEIPNIIKELTYLKDLDLGLNNIKSIAPIKQLSNLETLNLSNNHIYDLRILKEFKNLKNLTIQLVSEIDFHYLLHLVKLESLIIYIDEIPTRLDKLSIFKQLQSFGIHTFPHSSEHKEIDVLDCQFIGKLPKLKILNLSHNKINNWNFLKTLKHLTTLNLSRTKTISYSLPYNKKIKHLVFRNNVVENYNFLGQLKGLKSIDLTNNNINNTKLRRLINKLPNVEKINLQNNLITTLKPLRVLLQKMDCSLNEQLGYAPKLKNRPTNIIWLNNNPIIIPPKQVTKQGSRAILNYFKESEKGTTPNHRIKLIIIGNGRVGKTSLFKRIKGYSFNINEKYTHGIKIQKIGKIHSQSWTTLLANILVWDFGGQEIFYATHQFFLSDEALYLLAWTDEENVKPHRERDKEELPFDEKWQSNEYWLESIRLRSKTSPIIMVQTHIDCREVEIDRTFYAQSPYNAKCLSFSAAKNYGLSKLRDTITDKINNELPLYGKPFPVTYDNVIEAIENLKNQEQIPFIPYQKFLDLCKTSNISEGGEATLCAYLNSTGVVVHYPNHQKLKDKVYINPDWLTQQVYRLINNRLRPLEGKIDNAYLNEYLPDYRKTGLVALLKAFELIFEAEEEDEVYYIAPQYLPETYNSKAYRKQKRKSELAFVFRFPKFMPDNVMINFLSRYGSFAEDIYWKNGIYFTKYGFDCIVLHENGNELSVYTEKGDDSLNLEREICRAFVELSHHANAQISLNHQDFVDFEDLEKAYHQGYYDITSIEGKRLQVQDFEHFFKATNRQQVLAQEFQTALETIKRILAEHPNLPFSDEQLWVKLQKHINIENIEVKGGEVRIADLMFNFGIGEERIEALFRKYLGK